MVFKQWLCFSLFLWARQWDHFHLIFLVISINTCTKKKYLHSHTHQILTMRNNITTVSIFAILCRPHWFTSLHYIRIDHTAIYHTEAETNWPTFFAKDAFKYIFMIENQNMLIRLSLTFVPQRTFDYMAELGHVTFWHQSGNKPLPEPKTTLLLKRLGVINAEVIMSIFVAHQLWRSTILVQ